MELKRRRNERIMSICFNWFPISGLGEPYMYHDLGEFTRIGDRVGIVRILLGVIFGGCLF